MNKKMTTHLIKLTQECLERYWQHDYQYTLSHCSENVVWIGATMNQFMRGFDTVSKDFIMVDKELKKCHLSAQEFIIAHNDTKSCSICGRYLVTTDATEDIFLQVQQRCTFIWKLEENEPKIQCINVSNPMGELYLKEDEQFPNWLGKKALQHLNEAISLSTKQKRFSIADKDGSTLFLHENEVEYVQANNHSTILHLLNGQKEVSLLFADFMKKYGSSLVSVHRSYAVNPMYVVRMENNKIFMQSGDILPVPEKKISETREMLKNIIET